MLESIGLLQLSTQRMRYLSQRQALIGQNIANADTPGYHAKDLKPFTSSLPLAQAGQSGAASTLQLVSTNPAHMGFDVSGAVSAQMNQNAKNYDEKLDENNVSIEEQEMKANDVADAYSIATTAYTQSIGLLKSSLGITA